MTGPQIQILMEGYVDLEVDEVWPDGDAPAVVTAEDVAALMRGDTISRTLDDWCLLHHLRVTVHVTTAEPHFHGPDVFPGHEAPPALRSTRADVWQ